jgi:transposase
MARDILTDEQWERIRPLLPPQKPTTGRPSKDHRTVVNAILWIDRTGAPWRDLPSEYGPWQSVATRFYLPLGEGGRVGAGAGGTPTASGCLRGVRLEVASRGRERGSGAPACGGRAKKGLCSGAAEPGEDPEALGRSRGGFTTKIHLRAEGGGKPVAILITAGQRNEQSLFEALMETGAVKRAGRGRPRIRPDRVAGDKGYSSSKKIRAYLQKRGIGAVIAHRDNERRAGRFDKEAYRERNVVKRLIGRLKQFRRVATRYEKRAENYRAMLTIAAIVLWA